MVEDIAWWIGVAKGEAKEILEEMSDKVEYMCSTEGEYYG